MNENCKQPNKHICHYPSKTERDINRIIPSKLTKRELEDLYYKVIESNLELKQTVNSQRDAIKIMNTKIQRMTANQKATLAKEQKECSCVTTSAIITDQRDTIAELKQANERMAERIRALNMKLCSTKQFLKYGQSSTIHRKISTPTSNTKISSTSAIIERKNTLSAEMTSVSCQCLEENALPIVSNNKTILSPGSEYTTEVDKQSVCRENKCRTVIEELRQKIGNLQEELTKAHSDYSTRIKQLELELSELRRDNERERTERARSEHALQVKDSEAAKLAADLRAANKEISDQALQLCMEKKKVAEHETNLRAANFSNRIAEAIDKHLSKHDNKSVQLKEESMSDTPPELLIMVSETKMECSKSGAPCNYIKLPSSNLGSPLILSERRQTNTAIPEDSGKKDTCNKNDDSGYTDQNTDAEKNQEAINQELLRRIANLQAQLDELRLSPAIKKTSDKKSKPNKSFYSKNDKANVFLKNIKDCDKKTAHSCNKVKEAIKKTSQKNSEPNKSLSENDKSNTILKNIKGRDEQTAGCHYKLKEEVEEDDDVQTGYKERPIRNVSIEKADSEKLVNSPLNKSVEKDIPFINSDLADIKSQFDHFKYKTVEAGNELSSSSPMPSPTQNYEVIQQKQKTIENFDDSSRSDAHNKYQIPGPLSVDRKRTLLNSKKKLVETKAPAKNTGNKKVSYDGKSKDVKDAEKITPSKLTSIQKDKEINRSSEDDAIVRKRPEAKTGVHTRYASSDQDRENQDRMLASSEPMDHKEASATTQLECTPSAIKRYSLDEKPVLDSANKGFLATTPKNNNTTFISKSVDQRDQMNIEKIPISNLEERTPGSVEVNKCKRATSPDNTEREISSMTDLPSERETATPSPRYQRSPGEDKYTTTYTDSYSSPWEFTYLSEGELPAPKRGQMFSPGQTAVDTRQDTENMLPVTQKVQMTLQAISEELSRCRILLQQTRPQHQQQPAQPMAKDKALTAQNDSLTSIYSLKPVPGRRCIGDFSTPKGNFTLHIGTVVLCDEVVINCSKCPLVLTWKFYDQSMTMTCLQPGRVVNFDFSTEYDIDITDEFIRYMKCEQMPILISSSQLPHPFARCSLPLRDALLHTNRRADMSLALFAEDQLRHTLNNSDPLNTRDEIGILDLWCMLRTNNHLLDGSKPSALKITSPASSQEKKLNANINQVDADDMNDKRSSQYLGRNLVAHKFSLLQKKKPSDPDTSTREKDFYTPPLAETNPAIKRVESSPYSTDKSSYSPLKLDSNLNERSSIVKDDTKYYKPILSTRGGHDGYEFKRFSTPEARSSRAIHYSKDFEMKKTSCIANEIPTKIKNVEDLKDFYAKRVAQEETDSRPKFINKLTSTGSMQELLGSDNWRRMTKLESLKITPRTSKDQVTKKSVTIDSNYGKQDTTDPDCSNGSIAITVLWLALNEECEAMLDPKVQKLFVAYYFLDRDAETLETPTSLPKPQHSVDKCHFHFKRTFTLSEKDLQQLSHLAQCRSPAAGAPDSRDCVVFSVVSEPPEDPLGLESCEDIGYGYLYLGDLLAYCAGDTYTEVVPVRAARDERAVCGVLAVRVDGLELVRRCALNVH